MIPLRGHSDRQGQGHLDQLVEAQDGTICGHERHHCCIEFAPGGMPYLAVDATRASSNTRQTALPLFVTQ